jgi:hypothetical protein
MVETAEVISPIILPYVTRIFLPHDIAGKFTDDLFKIVPRLCLSTHLVFTQSSRFFKTAKQILVVITTIPPCSNLYLFYAYSALGGCAWDGPEASHQDRRW